MTLKTHGTIELASGRALLQANYRPGDAAPGRLMLPLEDQETFESANVELRLDPWIGDEYEILEFRTGNCFLICGAQAVVAVDALSLAWRSSVGLEYEEGETLDAPWHAEIEQGRLLLVATERRVWCVENGGAIRWLWCCATTDQDRRIYSEPIVVGDRVSVPVRTVGTDVSIELWVRDGLPT